MRAVLAHHFGEEARLLVLPPVACTDRQRRAPGVGAVQAVPQELRAKRCAPWSVARSSALRGREARRAHAHAPSFGLTASVLGTTARHIGQRPCPGEPFPPCWLLSVSTFIRQPLQKLWPQGVATGSCCTTSRQMLHSQFGGGVDRKMRSAAAAFARRSSLKVPTALRSMLGSSHQLHALRAEPKALAPRKRQQQ